MSPDRDRVHRMARPVARTATDPRPTLAAEAAGVLARLDDLAIIRGDSGDFRRCRDRLRDALATEGRTA